MYTHTTLDALALIRKMEPICADHGYHTALTGSVLYKGSSEKDTDIILYPHDPKKALDEPGLLGLLGLCGLAVRHIADANYVNRKVIICGYEDQRIDIFLL